MTLPTSNPTTAWISEKLCAALSPIKIEVIDDSAQHAGHAGAREGGHYTVQIVSNRFTGLSRPDRHRLVYDALGSLSANRIHALAVKAKSPDDPS